jgi:hypothetical protein
MQDVAARKASVAFVLCHRPRPNLNPMRAGEAVVPELTCRISGV